MDHNTQDTTQNKNSFFIYLLVVFFAMFVGTGLFLAFNSKNSASKKEESATSSTIKQEQIPTEVPTQGSFSLVLANRTTSANVGQEVQVDLIADSNENNISGYDLALAYDPLAFDFVKATSNLVDFKIYTYKKNNYLSLLGTKSLSSQVPSVFTQTKIISLFFKPVESGSYVFSLKPSIEVDKTDLVTDKTEILNPALNELTIDVK